MDSTCSITFLLLGKLFKKSENLMLYFINIFTL